MLFAIKFRKCGIWLATVGSAGHGAAGGDPVLHGKAIGADESQVNMKLVQGKRFFTSEVWGVRHDADAVGEVAMFRGWGSVTGLVTAQRKVAPPPLYTGS